jgi:hypothetical protein
MRDTRKPKESRIDYSTRPIKCAANEVSCIRAQNAGLGGSGGGRGVGQLLARACARGGVTSCHFLLSSHTDAGHVTPNFAAGTLQCIYYTR